jgi:hypothetical protein
MVSRFIAKYGSLHPLNLGQTWCQLAFHVRVWEMRGYLIYDPGVLAVDNTLSQRELTNGPTEVLSINCL